MLRLVANLGYSREAELYWLEHPLPVDVAARPGEPSWRAGQSIFPTFWPIPNTGRPAIRKLAGLQNVFSACRSCEMERRSAFSLSRDAVSPFTDKQIELVETFADQAVIAIENTRLFEAEQQRTRELTESLEQQTATSEVLQVISSSPGDLQPVFAAMLEKAVRICDAKFGSIYRWDGDALHLVATHNTPPAFAEARRRSPFRPGPKHRSSVA